MKDAIVRIPDPNISHYPKFLLGAETANNKTINQTNNEKLSERMRELTSKMKAENITKFQQSYFEYFGAYPYVFESVAFLITQMTDEERRTYIKPVQDGLFFELKISWERFKDAALDGITGQTNNLIHSLRDLAMNPKGKTIPISETQTVTTVPIQITLINKDGTECTEQELDYMEKLNNNVTPIKGIYITCFTPFFSDIISQNTNGWLPLPKAFYAKMIDTQMRHKNEMTAFNVTGYSGTYRKAILYSYMKDNKGGGTLTFNAIDFWLHVNPSEVQTYKTADGTVKSCLRRGKQCRLFIAKTNKLLNLMAKDGYLTGVTYAPNGVWWDEKKQEYTVYLKRTPQSLTKKEQKQIEAQKDKGKKVFIPNYKLIDDFKENISDPKDTPDE
jgi:hypothetical protein